MFDRLGRLGVSAALLVLSAPAAAVIAVSGDPLDSITELERVKWVMKGGVVYKDETGK